jgi:hypothetical protein
MPVLLKLRDAGVSYLAELRGGCRRRQLGSARSAVESLVDHRAVPAVAWDWEY